MKFAAAVALAVVATVAPAHASTLPCAAVPGVNDRCEAWAKVSSDGAGYAGVAVSAKGDRAYAVTSGGYRMTVTAYDPRQGTALWAAHPATDLPTNGVAIVVSPDGRAVYVTGIITLRPNLNSKPFDYFLTMRFDAKTGRILWAAVYKGIGANANSPTNVALSPRGDRLYVTGWSERPGPYQTLPRDWATLAYDTRNGHQRWVTRYAGVAGGHNEPRGIAVSPRGDRVYVTGESEHPTQNVSSIFDIATIAYGANGSARWSHRTPGVPTGLVLRGDHVWVGGAKTSGGGIVAAYAGASGAAVSTLNVGTVPLAFTVSPDEKRAYVAGIASASATVAAVSTLGMSVTALDVKTARSAWSTTYAPAGTGFSMPDAIEVNAAGTRVYATGVTGPAFLLTYPVTVCLSREGVQTWVARYDVRDPSAPSGSSWGLVVPRAGGKVFVTGTAAYVQGGDHGLLLAYGA